MNKSYIFDAVRTPIANFGGSLKDKSAVELGIAVMEELVNRNNLYNKKVDGVIMGNVLGSGLGQNPARQCTLGSGLKCSTPSLTINKVCGSSMKSVDMSFRNISGDFGSVYIAGGMESMSNSHFLIKDARWGLKMGDNKIVDQMIKDGLTCPFNLTHMGKLVDEMAEEFNISRAAQDEFALSSNTKAIDAIEQGKFNSEVIPVGLKDKKDNIIVFDKDERPRKDTDLKALSRLKPAFSKNGTVTAGNASGINDGAAAMLIGSGEWIKRNNIEPMAEIIATSEAGVDPKYFGIAPVDAIKEVLKNAGLVLGDIELIELNEAFAAQSIAVIDKLNLNKEIVNVNGGAIALGHPIGASGARIIVTLLYEMIKRDLTYGLATLCIGSGEAMAVILKRGK